MATIKDTKEAIKSLPGVVASHSDGEWQITIATNSIADRFPERSVAWCKEKQEAMMYYATDADDALGTAKRMSEEWVARETDKEKLARLEKMPSKHREFAENFHQETGIPFFQGLTLSEQLFELAAQHYVLTNMHLSDGGLSKHQEHARDAIEQQITKLLDWAPNVNGAHFIYDPRGTTVGIKFKSGLFDSLNGTYKVPLNPDRVNVLRHQPFWEAYPAKTDDIAANGAINMTQALSQQRVFLAEPGSGIAEGEYRFVVTTPDFEGDCDEGEVWLVNAKGEIAAGYESPQTVRVSQFCGLTHDEIFGIRAVAEGRMSFGEFERELFDDAPGPR